MRDQSDGVQAQLESELSDFRDAGGTPEGVVDALEEWLARRLAEHETRLSTPGAALTEEDDG